MIAENFEYVKQRIVAAAEKAGRDPKDIRLVAITKGINASLTLEGIQNGAKIIGENKVQEAKLKKETICQDDIEWHFIGHLQKNKVKFIFGLFDLIHSVDSLALAEEIHDKAHKLGLRMPILLQVNVSGEKSKFGIAPDNLLEVISKASMLGGLNIKGLMTITPYDSDPEKSRPHYAHLRGLRDQCHRLVRPEVVLNELSMGMSNDYEIAIEEGATLVRVGTALFGP